MRIHVTFRPKDVKCSKNFFGLLNNVKARLDIILARYAFGARSFDVQIENITFLPVEAYILRHFLLPVLVSKPDDVQPRGKARFKTYIADSQKTSKPNKNANFFE